MLEQLPGLTPAEVYPGAVNAIRWIGDSLDGPWGLVTIAPEEVVSRCLGAIQTTIAILGPDEESNVVRQELAHPDFLRFVKAKMGAC